MSTFITALPKSAQSPLLLKQKSTTSLKEMRVSLDTLISKCKNLEQLTHRERLDVTSSSYINSKRSNDLLHISDEFPNFLMHDEEYIKGKNRLNQHSSERKLKEFSDQIKSLSARYVNKKNQQSEKSLWSFEKLEPLSQILTTYRRDFGSPIITPIKKNNVLLSMNEMSTKSDKSLDKKYKIHIRNKLKLNISKKLKPEIKESKISNNSQEQAAKSKAPVPIIQKIKSMEVNESFEKDFFANRGDIESKIKIERLISTNVRKERKTNQMIRSGKLL